MAKSSWQKAVADKYINRDGSAIAKPGENQPAPKMIATAKLAAFIAYHQRDDIWGGVTKKEALDAVSTLTGLNSETLKSIGFRHARS